MNNASVRALLWSDSDAGRLRARIDALVQELGGSGSGGHVGAGAPTFKELGLDSKKCAALIGRLSDQLKLDLPLSLVFDFPSADALAEAVLELGAGSSIRERTTSVTRVPARRADVAIIGIGCRLPGGCDTPRALAARLLGTATSIGPMPPDRAALTPSVTEAPRVGSFVDDIDAFDAAFFGVAPAEAAQMDPQQRIALEVTWAALEHAGIPPRSLAGSQTGVYAATAPLQYAASLADFDAFTAVGNEPASVAGRISQRLTLRGPSLVVDAACASSLVATCLACDALRAGQIDLAIVVATNLALEARAWTALERSGVLSPTGSPRPFDERGDGYVRGEGVFAIVLAPADSDVARDRTLASIVGYASGHAGSASAIAMPSARAQVELMHRALDAAGIEPSAVGYVEGHGPGTEIGDAIELGAIVDVYGAGSGREDAVWVGSVKGTFGHLEPGAGLLGLLRATLSAAQGVIPPTLGFEHRRGFDFADARVAVTPEPRAWIEPGSRIAAVSAFGASGVMAHVLVRAAHGAAGSEELATPRAQDAREPTLLTLSARSRGALRALREAYLDELARGGSARELGTSALTDREHFGFRIAVAGHSEDLPRLLASAEPRDPPPITAGERPIAFVYSGHGGQWVGMARDLYAWSPIMRAVVDECVEGLPQELRAPVLGWLHGADASQPPPDDVAVVQPALFIVQVGLTRLLRSFGLEPAAVVGHSVGEFAAAEAAQVLSLPEALSLVIARGRALDASDAAGLMAALEIPLADVQERLRSMSGVELAAVNGERQVVVSGEPGEVRALCAWARARGGRTKELAVVRAGHSRLIEPALPEFAAAAQRARYGRPTLEMASSLLGRVVMDEIAGPDYWVRQLREPVRFDLAVQALRALGVTRYVELGPRPLLMAAAESPSNWEPTLDPTDGDQVLRVLQLLAERYLAGAELAWQAIADALGGRRTRLPTYRFERTRYWAGMTNAAQVPSATHDVVPRLADAAEVLAWVQGAVEECCSAPVIDPLQARDWSELSVDSLGLVKIAAGIGRRFGVRISLPACREARGIRGLADAVVALLGAPSEVERI